MKIEIKTLQDFIDIKAKMEGVIVITDKPTSSNKTHRLSCPYLEERHFTQKVVQNKNLNGHYFWVSEESEAVELNAEFCLHCK